LPSWEIIVVNNDSTDNTAQVLENYINQSSIPICQVFEPCRGQAYAKNAGIRVARHELLAFTDDDCLVSPDWLTQIHQTFKQDPDLAIIGGKVDLFDPEDFPIAVRVFDDFKHIVTIEDIYDRLIGCNMAVTAKTLQQVGGFDTSFGPASRYPAGEDFDFMYRALTKGLKIVYTPSVRIRHAHGRRDVQTVQSSRASYAKGRGGIYGKYIRLGHYNLIQHLYWQARKDLKLILNFMLFRKLDTIKVIYSFWAGVSGRLLFSRTR
jgi:glycosyltransferase involved in cell wall biosynthesis